ncbi:MAG: hypothetical protein RJA07_1853 [Bacteroidota bacterium]|jgi:hypothetical protein
MKKHLLLAAALITCISSQTIAQYHHHHNNHYSENHYHDDGYYQPRQNSFSVLKFSIQNACRTIAIIDGQNYGTIQSLYTGINLSAGNHYIQLYKKANCHSSVVIFNGEVWLKPNYTAIATFDYYNGLIVNQQPMYNTTCHTDDEYSNYNQPCTTPITSAVDEHTFCIFKNIVKNAWFDSDKQTLIYNFLSRNYINSNQLEQLLMLVDFESTKMAIAKEAYSKVIDNSNY